MVSAGEWVKGKAVGSGSFGTVHLALSKSTGGLFVVKSAQSGTGMHYYLQNEARILQSLDSPYIVRCLGKAVSQSLNGERTLDLFMEYMPGGSLSDVADKFGGVLDERVIRLYTREILKGLNYLHGNGIVHCDVKCKNVLLGLSGNVKLADFGCARRKTRVVDYDDDLQLVGGTPLWMAPEVLRNEALDYVSDIWSLGCTVIEMATGKPPWGSDDDDQFPSNPMAAVLKIACGEEVPRFPSRFSKQGLDFLEKCFDRNPETRWRAHQLLNHPFVSIQLDSYSPQSILDAAILNSGCQSDDDPDSQSASYSAFGNEIPKRMVPFLTQMQQHDDFQLVSSSEKWLTVRS